MKRQATDWEKIYTKTFFDKKSVMQNTQRTLKTQQENKQLDHVHYSIIYNSQDMKQPKCLWMTG